MNSRGAIGGQCARKRGNQHEHDGHRAQGGEGEAPVLQHVEGVIVSGKNEVLVSSGLRPHLMLLSPPTDKP
jgi:hypothetical protein